MKYYTTKPSTAVGLLLEQEKAYDRIHHGYLCEVISRIGFLDSFIRFVCCPFFGTRLRININSVLSYPVLQMRGLHQDDSLSLVLFHLAFYVILSLHNVSLPLFILSPAFLLPVISSIKLLVYTDGVVCLTGSSSDLHCLFHHYEILLASIWRLLKLLRNSSLFAVCVQHYLWWNLENPLEVLWCLHKVRSCFHWTTHLPWLSLIHFGFSKGFIFD